MIRVFFIMFILFMFGCAAQKEIVTVTVYEKVYLPVPCDIKEPDTPPPQDNIVMAVLELKGYSESLRAALKACKGQ